MNNLLTVGALPDYLHDMRASYELVKEIRDLGYRDEHSFVSESHVVWTFTELRSEPEYVLSCPGESDGHAIVDGFLIIQNRNGMAV